MPTELTAELISSTWRPDAVRLSPDGSRVAWTAAPYGQTEEHGESAVWVAGVDGRQPARRWTYGGSDTEPCWSPDGNRIAFLSDRKERGTKGLYLLSLEGGEAAPAVVRKRSIEALSWAPDGTRIAFLAPDEPDAEDQRREDERDDADVYGERRQLNRLHVVDLASGEVTTVVDADLHVVSVAWSPDGSTLAFTAQADADEDEEVRRSVWVVAAKDGEARRISQGPNLDGLSWTSDGAYLVYVSPHEAMPQSSYTVWSVDLTQARPRCVGTAVDERACSIGVAASDDGQVAIQVLEGLGTRLEWTDPASGERSPLWTADGDIAAFDAHAGHLAAVVCRAAGPPEVWAGPPTGLRRLSDHHAPWADVTFGAVEDFTYVSGDGLDRDGVLIRPPGAVEGPYATVVLVHGGPYWRAGRALHCQPLDWGQWLACAGYAVLMPNYRGGAGHGNDFATSVRGDMGGAEWEDVMSAVDAAVERRIADPDRLGIGGWSQGGFLTAWAVTHTDRFRAGIMGAGVSDWGAMAAQSDLPTFEAALGGDAPWSGPGPHLAAERSPISYAQSRRTPLLILHGQVDVRVPLAQATAFHRALRPQDAPVELVTYPREPHGIGERRHQADLMWRVREFFGGWLAVEPRQHREGADRPL